VVHRSTTQESENAENNIHTGSDRVPRDIDWCNIAVQWIDKYRSTRRLKKQAIGGAKEASKQGLRNKGQSAC
jgi:hypothetical protein